MAARLLLSYLRFIAAHPRFLAFGFAAAFFSSFGQTFFISLSSGHIRETLGLTDGQFGTWYSLATLASGLTIIRVGRLIDTVDLRPFTATVCVGLAAACVGMSVANHVLVLVAVLFLLRLTGQGLLSHTASTSMARYFDVGRGKALSIAGLGWPGGEAALPILAVLAMGAFGWRVSWAAIGAFVLVVVVPIMVWLLRGHAERHEAHLTQLASNEAASGDELQRQWTRGEVLRDVRFYLLLPAVTAPGFIGTGVFFHQVHLVETKGWSMELFAGCFAVFAGTQLPCGLLAGPLVDRFGATRLVPFILLPMGAALAVLASSDHAAAAVGFMMLLGMTSGVAGTIVASMWAETYGVRHLGAIRAMVTSILVFATAGSPVSMGLLIDAGVSMEAISWMCLAYTLAGTVLAAVAVRR